MTGWFSIPTFERFYAARPLPPEPKKEPLKPPQNVLQGRSVSAAEDAFLTLNGKIKGYLNSIDGFGSRFLLPAKKVCHETSAVNVLFRELDRHVLHFFAQMKLVSLEELGRYREKIQLVGNIVNCAQIAVAQETMMKNATTSVKMQPTTTSTRDCTYSLAVMPFSTMADCK